MAKGQYSFMIFFFTIIGVSVHLIFLFKRELLFDQRTFKILLMVSFSLFLIFFLIRENSTPAKGLETLLVPFLALIVFWVMKNIYKGFFRQDAKDTFYSMDLKLMRDGVFNFLFWVVGLTLPYYLAFKVLR